VDRVMTTSVGFATVGELFKLDIPAKAEYVSLGRLALAGMLRNGGFSEDAVADLKLALTEACSNSVRHAYDHENGQVHLAFTLTDADVTIAISDEGNGFHEDDVDCPECQNLPGVVAEGGMGISIIRAVVDEFSLDRPEDGGSVLVLTKRRDL
jgi:serine/threonine-protein kinase RsbW